MLRLKVPDDAPTSHFLISAAIGALDVVGADCPLDRIIFCCRRGKQAEVADRARLMLSREAEHANAIAAICEAAADLQIGHTLHETVVARARAAVAKVEQTMAEMQESGALKAINREFKAAREAGLASSYSAFVHAKKLALLEVIAMAR